MFHQSSDYIDCTVIRCFYLKWNLTWKGSRHWQNASSCYVYVGLCLISWIKNGKGCRKIIYYASISFKHWCMQRANPIRTLKCTGEFLLLTIGPPKHFHFRSFIFFTFNKRALSNTNKKKTKSQCVNRTQIDDFRASTCWASYKHTNFIWKWANNICF